MTLKDEPDDANNGDTEGAVGTPPKGAGIVWNDTAMRTDFANVVNIQGTREQVELFFGTSKGLSFSRSGGGDVSVDLSNRLILTPHAAKRLQVILTRVLDTYEERHGSLPVDD